jgi:threonine/homoserine/homoserine lactone efflux protein
LLEQILVVTGITALVMVSPGPDMVLVMRNTWVGGRRAGFRSSLGILAGNAVHMTYCALGVGWVISQSIVAFSVLKYAGAAYLVFLGLASFRKRPSSLDPASAPRTRGNSWFVEGFVNNLLNPKGTLFYLGVFTLVITPEMSWGTTLVLVACMTTVSATFWVAFVHTLDQPAFRSLVQASQQTVERVFGALLIALGLRVAALDR